VLANLPWESGSQLLMAVPPGGTLLRTHFGWGFYGDTSSLADLSSVSQNLQVMGLCTTVGPGSETPPNARTNSFDEDPPAERWTYWEARAPRVGTYSQAAELVTWQDSGAQEPVDTKAMVSAKGVTTPDSLNLWASWAAAGAWDPSGSVNLWLWASILYMEAS
jgi:hypothetical protein